MKHLIIILTVVIFSSSGIFAQQEMTKDTEAKKILDALSKKTKSYESLRIKFSYTINNKQNNYIETQFGYAFLSGKKYKIIIPGNEIFSDGITVWTYMKEAEELTITEPGPDEESIFNPAKLFTIYESGYKYILMGQEKIDNQIHNVIDLYPELEDQSPYSKIRLKINKIKNQITSVNTFEKSGVIYTININEYKPNVKITDKLFTFDKTKYPENIEIVDMR